MNMHKKLWKHFNTKNMGEYHDFYLKNDVHLLAVVVLLFSKMTVDMLINCFDDSGGAW